jgi:hypothetical protein
MSASLLLFILTVVFFVFAAFGVQVPNRPVGWQWLAFACWVAALYLV